MARAVWFVAALLAPLMLVACADPVMRPGVGRHAMAPPTLDVGAARAAINAYRAHNGLPGLVLDAKLMRAAQTHAEDLARRDRLSHKGADGSDPWVRVRRAGFQPRLAAENVGAGHASFNEVLKGWQDSRSHDRNLLLSDATHMGIALVYDSDTSYQTFWALVLGATR